jgi:2-oxoglutarate ferredoxin oxidoreductase subunit gamma
MLEDSMDRYDIRMAGLGGQGLLLAGLILGEAAAVHDGKSTVQTISYAPLVRGAPSRSELVISDGPIYFPEVEEADILLALSQDAFNSFSSRVKPGGIIVVDTVNVTDTDSKSVINYPITKIAEESTGKAITGSMVGLGIISNLSGRITSQAIESAIKTHAPRGTVELNIKALYAGLQLKKPDFIKV